MASYTSLPAGSIEPDVPSLLDVNAPSNPGTPPIEPSGPSPARSVSSKSASSIYQISYYSRFFDINTEEFFGKIVLALNPLNQVSVVASQDEEKPTELYGFFWINATLVVLMFISSTGSHLLADWIHSSKDAQKYEYHFLLLFLSSVLFFGYTVAVPLLLYVVTTYVLKFHDRLSLTRLISIYSYSNVLWIPATALNVVLAVFVSNKTHRVLSSLLSWTLVVACGVLSGMSILLKVRPIVVKNAMNGAESTEGRKTQRSVLFAILAAHVIFTLLLKVSFFDA